MVVAADIHTEDNHLVISEGTALSDKIITRLEFYSITELLVYHLPSAIDVSPTLLRETFNERIRQSESFQRFRQAYQNVSDNLKSSLDSIVYQGKNIDSDQLLSDTEQILNRCKSNTELFNMLHCMRDFDDTTYVHSLNVALICNIIGRWLHFIPEDLETITLSGLLHDIGKLFIPPEIILKPAKLSDDEFTTIKTHAVRGYNLLKNQQLDSRIKLAALMHHERCDGSGYPHHFSSDQIHPYAKLVAIADVYDAMTSARVYRGPLCPFEVLSIFETEGYTKYDPKYVIVFMENIAQTYINNSVRLSNDMIGEIIMINQHDLSKPIVKVNNEFIDLSRKRELSITALI